MLLSSAALSGGLGRRLRASSAGGFSTGGGGQRPAQHRPQHRPARRASARPQLHRCAPRGPKKIISKKNPQSPACSGLAVVELCVPRTGRSRCRGTRLCALGAAGGRAVSAVCVHGASGKTAWKQLLQHAAAAPESPFALGHQLLSLGASRAGRRAALTVEISEQGPLRDSAHGSSI